MLTNFTEMVDGFPEKVDSCRSLFSRCARSINLVDLFLWDCPGAGTENLVDFSKVSLAARDGLVYAGAGLCSPAARNP